VIQAEEGIVVRFSDIGHLLGSARAQAVYGDLLAAAEALLAFVKTCKGRTNKDNAKLASQIRNLIEKWKR